MSSRVFGSLIIHIREHLFITIGPTSLNFNILLRTWHQWSASQKKSPQALELWLMFNKATKLHILLVNGSSVRSGNSKRTRRRTCVWVPTVSRLPFRTWHLFHGYPPLTSTPPPHPFPTIHTHTETHTHPRTSRKWADEGMCDELLGWPDVIFVEHV